MEDLIFVSAQPDDIYFHWQVELYLYQFAKHGIKDKCYAIFGYTGNAPSQAIVNLSKTYNIRWYKDTRTNKEYIPSIVPHLMKQFVKDHHTITNKLFYHDSDIFIVKLPKFELLLNDDIGYLSDTISYIGYEYIVDCSKRYKRKHPSLPDGDLLTKMCACVGISENIVKVNQSSSGGAQYLLKNTDEAYWKSVETSSNKLYTFLKGYAKSYPIDHHIQSWTAGMWAHLWEYWKLDKKTAVHSELDFSWATDPIEKYYKKNIFHLAGVTTETASDKFYKGKFTSKNVFKEYLKDTTLFDHVSPNSATFPYANMIKEYAGSF